MCSSAAQPQTKAVRPQGRANSELRNVAPAAGGRPQKTIKKNDFDRRGLESRQNLLKSLPNNY
ncbi:hypothetical protein SGRA_3441 [Saprospira grandis str. Lewin]|uniref:Uncharacterized protein n=1 Tax=Saprospira grandis (strain Lewin) TaxID=984262 RepID=H6L1T8_SAPGL|nr:hypothetical protein SGRA_3441 [Saprospira grandis str. Lewin]